MAEVRYTITSDQKATPEQKEMISEARKKQELQLKEGRKSDVFSEDCPETNPVLTPKRYEAMMAAVAERNRRIASLSKKRA